MKAGRFLPLLMLALLVWIALFANLIANNKPLYLKYKGTTFFPAWRDIIGKSPIDSVYDESAKKYEIINFQLSDWRSIKVDKILWAPIAYSPTLNDVYNREYKGPFDPQEYQNSEGKVTGLPFYLRHYLGTNQIGQDVASGLVHATSLALRVGLFSMLIAGLLGLLIGSIAGYTVKYPVRMNAVIFAATLLFLFAGIFYGFIVRTEALTLASKTSVLAFIFQVIVSLSILIVFAILPSVIGYLTRYLYKGRKKIHLPIDSFFSRIIEITDSLPVFLLIITIASLFNEKNVNLMIMLIGLTSWSGIARITRAEMLKNARMDYTESANALGIKPFKIIFKHILPNLIPATLVILSFGIATAILIESTLSFLGIGVPVNTVSWGSLMASARVHFTAWWLIVFPGWLYFLPF